MRQKIVAGNWKMHGSRMDASALLNGIKDGADLCSAVTIIVFPSFVLLPLAESMLVNSAVAWGGQNLYLGQSGAFTGEVSGAMLVDYGCRYVLVGHSERRQLFQESSELVAKKFKAAQDAGLQPVLCVGETQQQREQDRTEIIIAEQLRTVIDLVGVNAFKQAIVAYEPVWAIGTGLTATPDQAQGVHQYIRHLFREYSLDVADTVRILYGGSVKADNAAELFAMPDIDGGLVGGASLDAKSFLAICQAAN